jgi:hypothetical protein
MKTNLNSSILIEEKEDQKTLSFLTHRLSLIIAFFVFFTALTYAQEKKFDPTWDKIDSKATKIAEFEGGQLYKQNAIHIVVLNGTYYEMGRQYGHLLKEQMAWHLNELKNEFFVTTAGNNPVDQPAPLMNHKELTKMFMAGYYNAMPYDHKQMLKGATETSGLSFEDVVFMEYMLQAVIYSAGISGCTSAAVWGEASRDGRLYTGRNHDFGLSWRERLGRIAVVRITNPANSDISVAAFTRAGQLTTAIDLINSKGLYIEFNNADNTRPSSLPTNMRATDNLAFSLVSDYQSVEELNVIVPTMKSNDALLMLAADPTEAMYFELSPNLSVRTEPELLDGQLTSRANQALHPVWNMDVDSDPERAIAFSKIRRKNMVEFLSKDPSTNDDAKMRAFLSKEIIVDGKVSDGAACIMEPAVKVEDWTSYQTVTIPAELKVYWRIPTHTPWLEIDLKKFFTNK